MLRYVTIGTSLNLQSLLQKLAKFTLIATYKDLMN